MLLMSLGLSLPMTHTKRGATDLFFLAVVQQNINMDKPPPRLSTLDELIYSSYSGLSWITYN